MEMFQQVQLDSKLEELLLNGMTFISWNQIYTWYRVAKITKTPWRDIQNRWNILCESQGIDDPLAITVRGITGGKGGVWLVRPHIERFDGTETQIDELI
ncbi:hypothetical protein [Methylomicrobium agile]|uniref:hypothetical protein n=1 Tax=Methylomicrobium agile TaxID=39774 RepID=UPI0004DFC656|nr:hypothetical protein [Methylomicrobium agile]